MWKPQIFELTEGILNWEAKQFLFPSKNSLACKGFGQAASLLKWRTGCHRCLHMNLEWTQC